MFYTLAISVSLCSACVSIQAPQSPAQHLPPVVVGEKGYESALEAKQTMAEVAHQAPDPEKFRKLLSTLQSLSDAPLYNDSRAHLLIDGPQTYAAMLEAIRTAVRFIHLETYIFADDEVGRKFAEALLKKAQEGVKVRVIYDSLGSIGSNSAFFDGMKKSGVELIEYHRLLPLEGGNPLNLDNRDHRKLMVVDDRVAFTGGVNLSKEYSNSWSGGPSRRSISSRWRDTHLAIRGPAVEGFELAFEQQWVEQGGIFDSEPLLEVSFAAVGEDLVAVLQSEGDDGEVSSIYQAYLEAMHSAEFRIWITQAYFAPDKEFMQQISDAAGRGVDVRLLVPGTSDSNTLLNASRSRYGELLKKGVRIYESQSFMLHAKTAVIDRVWSTVGSSNLDYRSFLHNDEINAIVLGINFARQMEDQFLKDLKNSREISLRQWKTRKLRDKIKQRFAWLITYML